VFNAGAYPALDQGGVHVKRLTIVAVLMALALGVTVTTIASTATGTTTFLDLAAAGSSAELDVSVVSSTLVVPHEYALQNECYYSGEVSGLPDSFQRDDIVNWTYSAPPPYGDVPHAILTVDLTTVPAGSTCRVFLVKGNSVVQGSTTEYQVVE
jgi:hypothetical protein